MSKILRAVLRTARGLHASRGITDEKMKEFEELCAPKQKKTWKPNRARKNRSRRPT